MDALSRLLAIYPIRTRLDLRCQFKGPWKVENERVELGVVPFHVVIAGSIQVNVLEGSKSTLSQGDIIVFPKGGAHQLLVESSGVLSAVQPMPGGHTIKTVTNAGTGPASDVLCGEFRFEKQAAASLLKNLPDVIIVIAHIAKISRHWIN